MRELGLVLRVESLSGSRFKWYSGWYLVGLKVDVLRHVRDWIEAGHVQRPIKNKNNK